VKINEIEWGHPALSLLVLLGFFLWNIDYFHIFKMKIYTPQSFFSKKRISFLGMTHFFIMIIAWGFLAIAIMQPRKPVGYGKSEIKVNDIFIVVDVSLSMLAEDFLPNRLEAAKKKIREFIKMRPTDRIGIIMFAEKIFTLLPITSDIDLVEKMVDRIKTGPLGSGTNIGDSLGLAVAKLNESVTKSKIVIFLTDGVSNVGLITPGQATEIAKKYGIKVHSIAIGGDENARIPVGKDFFGNTRYQYIPGGSVDYEGLKKMAEATGGEFFDAKDEASLANIFKKIQELEKTEINIDGQVIYDEMYYPFLVAGVLIFILGEALRMVLRREII
jgi:Ca-activated chloride channel homolog